MLWLSGPVPLSMYVLIFAVQAFLLGISGGVFFGLRHLLKMQRHAFGIGPYTILLSIFTFFSIAVFIFFLYVSIIIDIHTFE